ncbi:MAG: hypothetical protein ACRDMV_14200 [Streptosporangiales bacterium]
MGSDGTVYVGAPRYDTAGSKNAGAVVKLTVSAYLQEELDVGGTLLAEGAHGVPGTPRPGDTFGTSISKDGALIGAPGKAVGGDDEAGAVFARVPGSNDYRMLTQDTAGVPGGAARGDRFGAATLALGQNNARGYVGAPGEAIGSEAGAGSVVKLQLDELTGNGPVEDTKGFHEGKGLVQGSPEAGDHFGAALGNLGHGEAIAGAPDEDVHAVADAGMVFRLGGDNVAWSQNSHGVPGRAEQGDRFGSSFGQWGTLALVGIPGENAGAGSVLAGLASTDHRSIGWHQQTGASESGDGFGGAMTYPYP